jgi:hypothetical protein
MRGGRRRVKPHDGSVARGFACEHNSLRNGPRSADCLTVRPVGCRFSKRREVEQRLGIGPSAA